jgi:hypothetical protein
MGPGIPPVDCPLEQASIKGKIAITVRLFNKNLRFIELSIALLSTLCQLFFLPT